VLAIDVELFGDVLSSHVTPGWSVERTSMPDRFYSQLVDAGDGSRALTGARNPTAP